MNNLKCYNTTLLELTFGAASVPLSQSCVVKLFEDPKKWDYFNAFERNKISIIHVKQIKENKVLSWQDATIEGENIWIVI